MENSVYINVNSSQTFRVCIFRVKFKRILSLTYSPSQHSFRSKNVPPKFVASSSPLASREKIHHCEREEKGWQSGKEFSCWPDSSKSTKGLWALVTTHFHNKYLSKENPFDNRFLDGQNASWAGNLEGKIGENQNDTIANGWRSRCPVSYITCCLAHWALLKGRTW